MIKNTFEKFIGWIDKSIELEKSCQLINLYHVFDDYDRPKYKTPKRILNYKGFKNHVEFWCKWKNFEIEKVIQFKEGEIFVNSRLVLMYLYHMDPANFALGWNMFQEHYRGNEVPDEHRNIIWIFDFNEPIC